LSAAEAQVLMKEKIIAATEIWTRGNLMMSLTRKE
jgi:hypothetical protein